MLTELTNEEVALMKGMLIGMAQEYNRRVDNNHYFTQEERELFDIGRGLLNKMEELE